jgi:UDP-4-amino-4-deoxy-L-arabinose-oxoglutarate aminotransferase
MSERVEFYEHNLGEAELASIESTIRSLFLTLGPRVGDFEQRFAAFLGVEHVVGVSSCSTGLLLSLKALGIGPGDEVITTPMTFVATSNAALLAGATPVFADVERATGLIDPKAVEAAITPRTRAIIAVHLYGQLADMRALRAVADRHQVALVEDAAHAIESERDGIRVAQLGDATVFSFYATKTMTSGDGGAIAVHDRALYERLKRLRNHGVTKDAAARHGAPYAHWDMVELGHKAALTDVEAALLLPQLEHLSARRDRRESIVESYERALASEPRVELIRRSGRSAHHLFTILTPPGTRDRVLAGLSQRGVGCAVNYRAVHTLAYYRERFGFHRDAFPAAAEIGDRTVSLPLFPKLTDAQIARVVAAVKATLADLPPTGDAG